MLTASGFITDANSDIRRILTVRPIAVDGRPSPPAFKVYREAAGKLCVPQYFGKSHLSQHPDDRRNAPVRADIKFVGQLRDYQSNAVALASGGGIISLPCGYGKSIVGLALAAKLGLRTMIMVHKEFLANQWIEVIQRFCPGASIGRVQADTHDIEKDFVICMIQTLCSREHPPRTFESIGLLIVDEAHHICAKVFSQTMFKLCPKVTIGLSATPERKDGLTRVLHWFLGPTVMTITRKSTEVKVREVTFTGPFPDVAHTRNGQLDMATMITDLTRVTDRNEMIFKEITELLKTNRNILVLSDRREHCQLIVDRFGADAGLYYGGLAQEALDAAASKRLIVGTFALAQEGLDIPKLDTVIFATPKADIVQASGRILRSSGNQPLVIDIIDQWCMFPNMFLKRRKQYLAMSFTVGGCLI